MFRSAVLAFVLVFATAPSVSALCRTWCDASLAAQTGCHGAKAIGTDQVASHHRACLDPPRSAAVPVKADTRDTPANDAPSGAVTTLGAALVAPFGLAAALNGRPPQRHGPPRNLPLRV